MPPHLLRCYSSEDEASRSPTITCCAAAGHACTNYARADSLSEYVLTGLSCCLAVPLDRPSLPHAGTNRKLLKNFHHAKVPVHASASAYASSHVVHHKAPIVHPKVVVHPVIVEKPVIVKKVVHHPVVVEKKVHHPVHVAPIHVPHHKFAAPHVKHGLLGL